MLIFQFRSIILQQSSLFTTLSKRALSVHEWELSVANQTLWWIKSNYGLLWTHPKGIYFTAPVPGALGTLHRQVTSPPEDLNGNNSRFGAALSFSVSKAMLSPELTLRWAPCQGRLLHGECRRSCEGLGVRHQTQSLQDDRFQPTTTGKSRKSQSRAGKDALERQPCCVLWPLPAEERQAELLTGSPSVLAEACREAWHSIGSMPCGFCGNSSWPFSLI